MNVLGLMRCNKCGKVLEEKDFVALSHINTIYHLVCGSSPKNEGFQDAGTFEFILGKYPFMQKV